MAALAGTSAGEAADAGYTHLRRFIVTATTGAKREAVSTNAPACSPDRPPVPDSCARSARYLARDASEVEIFLPQGPNWVAGEINRALDVTLRTRLQFEEQSRRTFRSGTLDAGRERTLVSLMIGRTRQVLASAAKGVLSK